MGAPQPLPDEVALDGVDEFLTTCVATTAAWPHKPAVIDYHALQSPHADDKTLQVSKEQAAFWLADAGFKPMEDVSLFSDKWFIVYQR